MDSGSIDFTFFVLLVGFLFLGTSITSMNKHPKRKFVLKLFVISFLVRTVLLFLMVYIHDWKGWDPFFSVDDVLYHTRSDYYSMYWHMGQISFDLEVLANQGYFLVNTIIYYLLGPNTFYARVINIFLSSLTVVLMYLFTSRAWNIKIGRIVGLLCAFVPSMMVISIFQFKDSFILFFIAMFFYFLQLFAQSRNPYYFLLTFVPILLVFNFREPVSLCLLAILIYYVLKDKLYSLVLYKLFLLGFGVVAFIIIIVNLHAIYQSFNLVAFQQHILGRLSGESILLRLANINPILGYLGSLYLTLFRGIDFTFGTPVSLWLFASNILNAVALFPMFVIGLLIFDKKRLWDRICFYVVIIILAFCVFGMMGANFRYFLPIDMFSFIFIAQGAARFREPKYFPIFLWSMFFSVLFSLLYIMLKYI